MKNKAENPERIYALDLLRSIAIIAVFLYHFPRPETAVVFRGLTHFGLWGVDLFFILSGYLIGGQWFRAQQKGKLSVKNFFYRRFMRTLPSYYVFLIAVIISRICWNQQLPDWRYWFFLQNIGEMNDLTHTWSLCVEEHFYLLFPIVGIAVWKYKSKAPIIFTSIFLIPLFLRAISWYIIRPDLTATTDIHHTYLKYFTFIFYPTPMRLDTLAIGICIAFIQTYNTSLWNQLLLISNKLLGLSILLLVLGVLSAIKKFSFFESALTFSFVGPSFGLLLISSLGTNSLLTRWKLPLTNQIALLSYTLYLTHLHAFAIADYLRPLLGNFTDHSVVSIVLRIISAILVCLMLHLLVEKPFLKLRDRWLTH